MEDSVVTRVKYRSLLPFSYILIITAIASSIVFIYYASEWNKNNTGKEDVNFISAKYGYYGSVISLLMILVFFNGYHLTI